MRKEVRVEGTPFTRRRTVVNHTETPDEMRQTMTKIAEATREDPWTAQQPTRDSIRASLKREVAAHPPEYQFKRREDAGWYLSELEAEATIIDHHIARGEPSRAATAGIRFGRIYAEFELKLAREELYLVGARQVEHSREGIERWRKGVQADRVREVDERPDGVPKAQIFRRIAKREGVTAGAIRTDYYEAKKKLSKPHD